MSDEKHARPVTIHVSEDDDPAELHILAEKVAKKLCSDVAPVQKIIDDAHAIKLKKRRKLVLSVGEQNDSLSVWAASLLLLAYTVFFVAGLLLLFNESLVRQRPGDAPKPVASPNAEAAARTPSSQPALAAPSISPSAAPVDAKQPTQRLVMIEALVVIFAGGLGATVYAIRGLLLHACTLEDFSRVFLLWYPFRIIQGITLALIIYFTLKAGMFVLTPGDPSVGTTPLSIWAFAAISALVGLFSKYALTKLRDIFVVAFGGNAPEAGDS